MHELKVTDGYLIFNPENLSINFSKKELNNKKSMMLYNSNTEKKEVKKQEDNDLLYKPVLERLTIHISNTCNLDCSYCYASGGDYKLGNSIVNSNDAIEYVANYLDKYIVKNIMFFGGEPSLNNDAILSVCLFVTELYNTNKILNMPDFSAISNFYSHCKFDAFLAIARKFDFSLTTSIDGPPVIHDKNRYTNGKKPTYLNVIKNYKLARKIGLTPFVECTYTDEHLDSNISVSNLVSFFNETLDITISHITPVSSSPDNINKRVHNDSIDSFCNEISRMVSTYGTPEYSGFSIGHGIIEQLINKKISSEYCPAGKSEMTIGPEGNSYPCFMFVGHDQFKIEKNENIKNSKIIKKINVFDKNNHKKCSTCWAKGLCQGCLGSDYLAVGDIETRINCNFIKATREEAILSIYEKINGDKIGINNRESYREKYLI